MNESMNAIGERLKRKSPMTRMELEDEFQAIMWFPIGFEDCIELLRSFDWRVIGPDWSEQYDPNSIWKVE